jgi:SagB-type dehydrogenase family enzyme
MKPLVDERHPEALPAIDSATLPLRPRFLREVVVAQTDDGLIVDGASQLHVLWGEMAKSVLPSVIALLDGNRTTAEIASALPGISAQQLRESLSSLSNWGLIEDGGEDVLGIDGNLETVSFLRRFTGGAAVGRTGEESFTRLLTSEIVIIGADHDREATDYLRSLLAGIGFCQVKNFTPESFQSLPTPEDRTITRILPVVLALDGEDCALFSMLDEFCCNADLPWLRVVVDESRNFADIGPAFDRKKHPCYRCFALTHSRGDHILEGNDGDRRLRMKFWMSLVAAEITFLISQVAGTRFEGCFRRYNLEDWASRTFCFAAIPGCPSCRPLPQGLEVKSAFSGKIDSAMIFEDYVAHGPKGSNSSIVSDANNLLELTRQTKRLTNSPQHKLPATLPDLRAPVLSIGEIEGGAGLGVSEVASLLMMTAGIRRLRQNSGTLKRWAATAGNLGSVEVFIVIRQVDGLFPGYYFYQPQEHALASFRRHSGMVAIDDFMRRAAGCDPANLPDAMVLLTAAFHRVSSKYGPFAYRLINLDAGVALSQLRMVAAGMNLSSQIAPRWADDLIEDQLALDSMAEQSTAVVLLHGKASRQRSVDSVHPQRRMTRIPASTRAAEAFCEQTSADAVRMVFRDSRISESELHFAPFEVPGELKTAERAGTAGIPLPITSHEGRSVGDVLKGRRSVRRYTNEPVSLEQLSTMLAFAQRGDVHEWPEETRNEQPLRFMVLARRLQTLDPGVYEYDLARESIVSVREGLQPEDLAKLYVQDEFALAPVAIWITASLAAACARHGAFGHRQLLLRAGAAGNRLWMAGMGMGLEGALVAGMVPGAARHILGIDGYWENALLAVALGYSIHAAALED